MSSASTYSRAPSLFAPLFFAFIVVVGLVAGAIVGLGSTLLDVLLIGGVLGLLLLGAPAVTTVWLLLLLVFLVIGQLTYFGRLGPAVWIPYGIGLLLYFKLFKLPDAFAISGKSRTSNAGAPPLVWPVLMFIFAVFLSAAVNLPSPAAAVAGAKTYLTLWSVFFLIALRAIPVGSIQRMWKFFFLVAVFQVPLVVYQYRVVAPSRTTFGSTLGARWDSVVGGFGGDPTGGGASASMALFLSIVIFFAIALYRRKLLKTSWLALLLVISLGCIALAEVKVVAVLIPVGMLVLVAAGVRKSPLLTVALVSLGMAAVAGILYAYSAVHYADVGRSTSSPLEVVERSLSKNMDPGFINYQTGEMGRMAALVHWWDENVKVDLMRSFIGNGPGASRGVGVLGVGDSAKKYPFKINRSAAAQLLWDVGILGLAAFVLILLRGALLAFNAARSTTCPPAQSAALEAAAAGLLMMVVMLPYSRDMLDVPAMGVLMMFLLGTASLSTQLHVSSATRLRPTHASELARGWSSQSFSGR